MSAQVPPQSAGYKPPSGVVTIPPGTLLRPPTIPGTRAVSVKTKSTDELRDLVGLRRDIRLTRRFSQLWHDVELQFHADSRPDEGAYWMAALVLYGRAFGKGMRTARIDVSKLNAEQTALHKYVLSMRDKYVAHSVNDFDQAHIYAYVGTGDATTLGAIESMQLDVAGITKQQTEGLIELCDVHLAQIEERTKRLFSAVREELLALGAERVLGFPDLVIDNTGSSTERVTRPRRR